MVPVRHRVPKSCLVWSLPFVICVAFLGGCGPEDAVEPERIVQDPNASGDNQCGRHGETLEKPFRAVVQGPLRPGLLGGKGHHRGIRGASVTWRIQNPTTGAVFADNGEHEFESTTDAAGVATAHLTLGHQSRDVNVTASVMTPDGEKSTAFSALAGVEMIGKSLEAPTDGTIEEFGLRLTGPSGAPAAGVPVYFNVQGDDRGATVGGRRRLRLVTDEDGRAVTSWKLGKNTSQYFVRAEIQDDRPGVPESDRFRGRAIDFKAMAIDKRKMVMELFGGLAIFILGMRWMSAGLRRMADRRLKAILQAMTRNRFMATGVGAILTAIIQSSSATTVMTVGFVNAGLLTLSQAIAVDYGACIGTTVTAQIIAFKLNTLAFPAIALGLIMSATSKRAWVKSSGEAVLGFGLLFLGLTLMSHVLEPLRHSPSFVKWFHLFECQPADGGLMKAWPAFMCIVIGTVATMIVQSSSATIGLVIVLADQGLLSFYTAIPLVLGDNIGTTITAILASLGANRNAKRAAVAHTLFKVFGATYMYILLFVPLWEGRPVFLGFVDYITPGDVFAPTPEDLPRHIANAHTAFNVLNVALFLPLVGAMAALSRKIIPMTGADQEQVLHYLEPNLLDSPSLALQQAVREVAYMCRRAQKSINDGCEYFFDGGRELEDRIAAREELIDRLQHEITSYLVELSRRNLTPSEATLLPALVHAVNDAERIGDHSEDLVELTHLRRQGKHALSNRDTGYIRRLQTLLNEQFEATMRCLTKADASQVDVVLRKEDEITALMLEANDSHLKGLKQRKGDVQAGVIFLDFLGHLERIGDHLTNIAERAGRIIQVTGE